VVERRGRCEEGRSTGSICISAAWVVEQEKGKAWAAGQYYGKEMIFASPYGSMLTWSVIIKFFEYGSSKKFDILKLIISIISTTEHENCRAVIHL
jgi:hypothetical protein